jgi:hypothetical protein
VSAYSGGPTFTPASRAIAFVSFVFAELSGKIVATPVLRIVRASRATSPAEDCACVDSAGMTVPMTWMP